MAMNVQNTVYDLKRLMGRKFSDLQVLRDMRKWPFKLEQSPELYPTIELTAFKSRRTFKPEELMAMILTSAKETAENFVGGPVNEAVITVPSSFGNVQRQAIRDAAHIAGLGVLRLLNETTAAALAYGMEYKVKVSFNQNLA
jgi:molecular chaperone DnaK (HSP70)